MKNFLKIKYLSKLNILDWLIILAATGVAVFLIAASLNQSRWVTIEFKVIVNPAFNPYNTTDSPPYWLADKIKPGDAQYDNLGQKNLQVLNVKSWGFQFEDTWVTASVKAKFNSQTKKYTYLYQPLEIGRSFDIALNGTNVHGIVTGIRGQVDLRKTYDVTVKARVVDNTSPYSTNTRGIDPWIADALEVGQLMKDTSGKTIAEIIDKQVKPAERTLTTSDGKVMLGEDPLREDVYLTIKLKAVKQNDTYFFLEDKPIKIGFGVPIFLNKLYILPVITQIQFPSD